jgi:DNA repair protein RecO (recombination protein O)
VVKPRLFKVEALVLKATPLGEAGRLVTLYTQSMGKLRCVARGVRRPGSKLAGHLEPLTHTELLVARGRTLDVISQAQALRCFVGVRQDLGRTARAIYCTELVDAFTPDEEPSAAIFTLLLEVLRWIEDGEQELALRYFEVRLLEHLGYAPELYRCVQCTKEVTPGDHSFSTSSGGVVCMACLGGSGFEKRSLLPVLPLSLNALKVLRHFQTQTFSETRRLRLAPPLGSELEDLLYTYLVYLLEREPRSAAFLRILRAGVYVQAKS